MPKASRIDQFYQNLLKRSVQLSTKDGSLGLEVIASLHQYQLAYKTVQKHVSPGARVLDWGGGSGHFSFFLHEHGYQTEIYAFDEPGFVKIELGSGAIKHTEALASEPIKLPYADQSFDAVCSIGVLEHVREIGGEERASLQEIQRILKPGGTFICYHLPNSHSWIEWLAKRFGSYHHQYTFSESQIRTLFEGLLAVESCSRYAILPRNSLRRLPTFLTNSRSFSYLFDQLDSVLGKIIPSIHQNWLIIAKKK